jgi:hypothetical protein
MRKRQAQAFYVFWSSLQFHKIGKLQKSLWQAMLAFRTSVVRLMLRGSHGSHIWFNYTSFYEDQRPMSFISLLLKPKFVIVTSPSAETPVLDQKYIGSHVQLCDLANFARAAPPPAAYVGWLIAADYDAYDIGHALAKADFLGRCILISSVERPSRSLILRELSTAFDQI